MPDAWKKIAATQGSGAESFEAITRDLSQQVDAARSLANELEKQDHTLTHSERLWTSMARSSKELGGNILSATTSLLRWSSVLGVVGGLLGAGGLFGIGRLVNGVAGQRRSAMGRGLDYGQQAAFGINFGRLIDTESFMSRVAEMEGDLTQQPYALLPGGLSGNTEKDAIALLRAGRGLAQRGPLNMLGVNFDAFAPGLFNPEEQRRLRDMKPDEFEKLLAGNAKDSKDLGLSAKITKDAQELATQFERTAAKTEKFAVQALDPLFPKLGALSDEFSKAVGAFANSHLVKEAIDVLAQGLGYLAREVGPFLDAYKSVQPENLPGYQAGKSFREGIGNLIDKGLNWFHPQKGAAEYGAPAAMSSMLARQDQHWGLGAGSLELIKELENSGQYATSRAGAKGYFQLMPDTIKRYGGGDPFDPEASAAIAAKALRDLIKEFGGDVAKELAAYNAGEGAVRSAIGRAKDGNWLGLLPGETQAYVGRGLQLVIQNNTGGSAVVAASQLAVGP